MAMRYIKQSLENIFDLQTACCQCCFSLQLFQSRTKHHYHEVPTPPSNNINKNANSQKDEEKQEIGCHTDGGNRNIKKILPCVTPLKLAVLSPELNNWLT